MRYRKVGASDLTVSEVAFGCGGNAGLMVRADRSEQLRVVARALDLGLNYFDNSPDYGDGAAEQNLGIALKEIGARPLINSKVEIRRANLADIKGHVIRSVEESLARLQVDALDMLQIHNGPSLEPPDLRGAGYRQLWLEDFLRPGGACEGVEHLRKAGKIRYAGFICRGDDARAVDTLLDTGLFSLINAPYTLLNPSAGMAKPAALRVKDFGDVIRAAQSHGASAAIYSPLAGGFLTDDFLHGAARHPLARAADPLQAQRAIHQVKALAFLTEGGNSLAIAAYRFILSHPGVACVLGGFSSLEQLQELASAPDLGPLSSSEMTRLEMLWSAGFADP